MASSESPPPDVTATTVAHYERSADDFWAGTRAHDVSQNRNALLSHLEGEGPFALLDLGCGPGRDLHALAALGHEVVGLDGSPTFCEMARRHSGCEVWQQDFVRLALPPQRFDGVFANASLFHVPSRELPRVLADLHQALRPRGVFFASNPRGQDEEGFQGDRYGCYHHEETWCAFVRAAGFEERLRYWRPDGLPRAQQPWFATVWRKLG